MYSLQDIKNSRSAQKRYIDKIDVWVFYVVRPLANLLTWVLLKLKLTANMATLISTIIGVIGEILLVTTSNNQTLVGLIFINLWIVFDCIDGNIARTTKNSNKLGEYYDGLSGYTFVAFLYLALGINVYLNYDMVIAGTNYNWLFIVIGSLASMACIFPRLVEHKAGTLLEGYHSNIRDKDNYSLFYIVGLNIAGMAGLSNPLMIVAYFLNMLDKYLIFYFIVQMFIALYSIYKTLKGIRSRYR
ncbi:CDP-alcohol phosphatidyltransferase family protein [Latilactobacillus sakei]|uniref:CDP-alcohol phosphatidyltransferase family protein n=1 Tax=Latilactobacillus sakei TaxID=1599 RepID=UPI003F52C057